MQRRKTMKKTIIMALVLLIAVNVYSQERDVYKFEESRLSFDKRFNEAFQKARDITRSNESFWIGYTIDNFNDNSHFGSDRYSRDRETLEQLIYNKSSELKVDEREALKRAAERALKDLDNAKDRDILKRRYWNYYDERAVLLLYDRSNRNYPAKIKLLNLRQPFDRYRSPIFWLGKAKDTESISFLDDIYRNSNESSTRDKIVTTIGIHESKDLVFPALKNVIDKEDREKVIKNAIFWVGNIHTRQAVDYLEKLRFRFKSNQLMESIIFAFYNNDSEYADKLLIDIAKSRRERSEVRKKAIFWLSQRASKIAFDTLEEIVTDSDERKLQEHTVFAISQFPDDESIPALIKIAKNNRSKGVRKKAIFWLSQKDDPRVIRFLEDILLDR